MTDGNAPASSVKVATVSGNELYMGLTKREYFAAKAMQGILARESWAERILNEDNKSMPNGIAAASVVCADALINELNKQ